MPSPGRHASRCRACRSPHERTHPPQILDRLSQRLDLLKGGRDADPRQQTLRATIEWSCELLSPDEQQLFARLAVFAGGWTLEAAEEVANADLDTLQSLVEKSLLRFTDGRYWMLETIREFAVERLEESGEADRLHALLTRQLVELAEAEGAPNFLGRQPAAYARLELEHPNTRAVIEWALARNRHEAVLSLTGCLWNFWSTRHPAEARGWIEVAVADRRGAPDEVWVPALLGAGELARWAGDLEQAAQLKEELLELLPRFTGADPHWVPGTLADLADIASEQGDFDRAQTYAERSLAMRRTRGLSPARALGSLGDIALRLGDLDRAEALLRESAAGWQELGNESNYVATIESLGEVALRRGDVRRAEELFVEALRGAQALGDLGVVGICLQDLALVASADGQPERAGRLIGAGQALLETSGSSFGWSWSEPAVPQEAKGEGAAMTVDEAVEYALTGIDWA